MVREAGEELESMVTGARTGFPGRGSGPEAQVWQQTQDLEIIRFGNMAIGDFYDDIGRKPDGQDIIRVQWSWEGGGECRNLKGRQGQDFFFF